MHVRRLPNIVRECVEAGHEIGNHTETHAPLWLRSERFIRSELRCAQECIADATGAAPVLFRAPYGVRWFGLADVQAELGLMGVMWTVLGGDWRGDPAAVTDRIWRGRRNGAIICLHDGRERQTNPDISTTITAVRDILPRMLGAGYRFLTVSELIFDRQGSKSQIKGI
jgi:peptidoglycan/xylan/chitin deacetylase (PgdA/CDA1 family)